MNVNDIGLKLEKRFADRLYAPRVQANRRERSVERHP